MFLFIQMCERKVHDLEDENKVLLTENKMQKSQESNYRSQGKLSLIIYRSICGETAAHYSS